jgi:hypothetical protein
VDEEADMAMVEGEPGRSALVARVKNILLRPTAEWPVIAAEPASVRGLYFGYIAPLAAIGPVCGVIGGLVFGLGWGGLTFRPDPVSALIGAGAEFLLQLLIAYAMALVIDTLAPSFGGTPDRLQALKVSAYGATAFWLGGVFGLVPILGFLGVVGVYSIYLVYRGLPPLMKVAPERVGTYTGLVVVIAAILQILAGLSTGFITRIGLVPPPGASSTPLGGRIRFGDTEVDLGKAQRAAEAIKEEAERAKQGAPAKAPLVDAEELQTMLPASLPNGFTRSEIESSSGGAQGVRMAHARGVYGKGNARLTLEVTDLGRVGALAGALNVKTSRETADSYVRVQTIGGRMTTEEYDRSRHGGTYAVVVGDRFAVSAKGDNITVGDLKAAVGVVDFARLEAMSRD